MTNFTVSCPSKTFILGEYSVLNNGYAYTAATSPRFQLKIIGNKEFQWQNLHPDSPAGKFITKHWDIFKSHHCTFYDPYNGLGGLGASTAEFLLFWFATQKISKSNFFVTAADLDLDTLLETYLHFAWNGTGIKPSGADLLAQTYGGFGLINCQTKTFETLVNCSFNNYEFHLIHTHEKLATHSHLQALSRIETKVLDNIINKTRSHLHNLQELELIVAINTYYQRLVELKLVAPHTQTLINYFKDNSNLLAAKGCGAMGSDILLLVTSKNEQANIKKLCQQSKRTYIGNSSNLSSGVCFE